MDINQALDAVRDNAMAHQANNTKLRTILAEVAELAYALDGEHEHTPEIELVQIAGICVNWLVRLTRVAGDAADGAAETMTLGRITRPERVEHGFFEWAIESNFMPGLDFAGHRHSRPGSNWGRRGCNPGGV